MASTSMGRRVVPASFRGRFRKMFAVLNLLQVLRITSSRGSSSAILKNRQSTTTTSTLVVQLVYVSSSSATPEPRRHSKLRSGLGKVWSSLIRRKRDHKSTTPKIFEEPATPSPLPATPNVTPDVVTPDDTPPHPEPDVNGVATVVHGVGMVCTVIVLVQLAIAGWLPLFLAVVTGLVVVGKFVFNAPGFQQLWREALSIGGLAALVPQVLGVMFRPFLLAKQSSFISSEGVVGCVTLFLILLVRCRRQPFTVMQFFGAVSAAVPALLVLWAPLFQLWNYYWRRPADDATLMQILSGLLAAVSNCFQGYSDSSQKLSCSFASNADYEVA